MCLFGRAEQRLTLCKELLVYIQNVRVLLSKVLRHVWDAISGCLFHLTALIPVSPHSGDRVELRTAAEQGIEADSGSLTLLLSQSPRIIGALEIFTYLSSLHFSFLLFPMPPRMHSSPLEASLWWQFFDQSYSCQLPTTAWLTTSDLTILQASSLVPACSWSYFFPSFTVGCTEPSCPLWYPLFLPSLYHSDAADIPKLTRVLLMYFLVLPAVLSNPTLALCHFSVFLCFIHLQWNCNEFFLLTIYFQPSLSQKVSEWNN